FWNQRGVDDVPISPLESTIDTRRIHFIANARAGQELIHERFHVPAQHIEIVRNALAFTPRDQEREASRRKLGLHKDDVAVAMVANFFSVKDHPTALRAVRLAIDRGARVQLLLAGTGPTDAHTHGVRHLVATLGLQDHVRMLGVVRDIPALLAAVDVGVLTSTSEGSSNSLLEYAAAGRAIVASAIPQNADLLPPDYRYLAAAGNAPGFAQHLEELARAGDLRERTGAALRAFVTPRHEPHAALEAFRGLLDR
ncbi:MAG TPA: glycosyltransferase, partial [Myxococcota bacterium]